VDYDKGNVVVKEKCFAIQAVDKSIAQTRKWEKQFHLQGVDDAMTIGASAGVDD
jgi:hypothetical protein